nr:reverse transcriptase domain-containing protein [Tanacetum cinerariifolium]
MRTRSSSNLPGKSPPNPSSSNLKRRNCRRSKKPFILEESPVDTMADQRIMAELLRHLPRVCRGNCGPPILAKQFELKHSLINIMTSDQFFGLEKDNPHDHIRCDSNSSSSSEIAKLTHAVNQQTSAMTTTMTAILKQFQETPHPASVKAVEEFYVTCGVAHPYQCLAAGGNTFLELRDNIQGYVSAAAINYNQGNFGYRPPGVANQIRPSGASINLMPLSVWKKLGLPELISTLITLELANRAICTLAGIARDVFVLVGKFTFPADFVIFDYESDHRVLLILGRPFLWTAHALIDVHGEEMILRDGDERLTLNMRHDTSSYSNQPKKESINMINIFNDSSEDFLKDLFETNNLSGNPTFSSHPNLTAPEVKDDIFDPEGGNVLIKKLLDLDSTKDLHPPHNVNPLSGGTTSSSSPYHLLEEFVDKLALITFPPGNDDLPFDIRSDHKEIQYLLNNDPIKKMDSILEDSVDGDNLANLNDNLANTMPEMFTDEHALDYLSPPLYDEYDDDLFEVESDTEYVYDDLFDSKGEKIKESKFLINELDLPRSSDFLPFPEYDSFLFEDFSNVDALPLTDNED